VKNNFNQLKDQNRKSTLTGNMAFPRQTTAFGGTNKSHSEVRPIKDAGFQTDCQNKIVNFLCSESFEKKTTPKELSNPSTKDFVAIFTFIYSKIRPETQIVINRVEEELPIYLGELRYPGYLARSHLAAICVPNIWPHFLALLAWMVELANYMAYEEDNIEDGILFGLQDNSSNENPKVEFERAYNNYLLEGFKQNITKNDYSMALESLKLKFNDVNSSFLNKIEKYTESIHKIKEESEGIDKVHGQLKELELLLKENKNLLDSKIEENKHSENQVENLIKDLTNILNIFDKKNTKINELAININDLETTITNQKVSFEDFERIKAAKEHQEKQYQFQKERNKELNETLDRILRNKEELLNIHEQVNATNNLIERKKLPSEYSLDVAGYFNTLDSLDQEMIKNIFQQKFTAIQENTNQKNKEIKDKKIELVNIEKDSLQVDTEINEINNSISNIEKEIERKNIYFTQEKEKYNQLILIKNEEIQTLSENIQRSNQHLNEKGKLLESLQNDEIIKKQKLEQAESEFENRIVEMEEEYLEVVKVAEQIKADNIKEIRKGYKTLEKIFLALKGDL
jgi:kinetochore protein NDC80